MISKFQIFQNIEIFNMNLYAKIIFNMPKAKLNMPKAKVEKVKKSHN